jgi:hypothetical protein
MDSSALFEMNYKILWKLSQRAEATKIFYGSFRKERKQLKSFMEAFASVETNYKIF